MPGNWITTLDSMKSLEGSRGHLTHIQFHSYGGGDGDENTFNSKVEPLADYVRRWRKDHALSSHPEFTLVNELFMGELLPVELVPV